MDEGLRAPRGKTGELPEITFLVRKVRERIVRKAKSGRGLSCTLAGRGEQAPGVPVTVSRGAGPERPPRRRGRAPSRGAVLAPPTSLAGPAQGSWLRAAGGRLGLAHLRPAGGSTWPGLPPAPRNSRSLESDTVEAGRQWKYVFGKKTAGQSLSIKLGDTKVPPKTRLADRGTDDPISPVAGRD